jgi:hypothetical protein
MDLTGSYLWEHLGHIGKDHFGQCVVVVVVVVTVVVVAAAAQIMMGKH